MSTVKHLNVVPVILAGGSGTRLWPLSKPGTPKQFLSLFGGRTLLQETIARILPLPARHLLVVTGAAQQLETEAQLRDLGLGQDRVTVLAEPCARNTAPAIALVAAFIRDRFGPEARMVVLPADHHVGDANAFRETIRKAVEEAGNEMLVTIGVRPTGPATGYGYIHAAEVRDGAADVRAFVEKPDRVRAEGYVASGDYFWNSGMFVWTSGTILRALERHLPEIVPLLRLSWEAFCQRFAEAPDISVDYAVLEKAAGVRMVPAAFAWSDVGTWDSVVSFLRGEGRFKRADVEIECESIDVFAQRPVAVVGLGEIIVIDGDQGILILKKGHGQSVGMVAKVMAEKMMVEGGEGKDIPRIVPKPWGEEFIWAHTPRYVGKVLRIRKGESLSLQYHRMKDETINVLRGTLIFRHGPHPDALQETRLGPGESFHIRTRTVHQMEAAEDCEILEVSTPELDDVVRLNDRYGRAA